MQAQPESARMKGEEGPWWWCRTSFISFLFSLSFFLV